MKYGKILTYKDVEEAKRLIGKKIAVSDSFKLITEDPDSRPHTLLVCIDEWDKRPFICEDNSNWQFAREIEEESPKRMTYRQLSKWLARGNGQAFIHFDKQLCFTDFHYQRSEDDIEVPPDSRIRTWDSEEWIVPTFEIYERDCRK